MNDNFDKAVLDAGDDPLARSSAAIQRNEPEAALAILDKCIEIEGVNECGLNCRLMRAMGYGNGLFSHPDARNKAIEDYQFVKKSGHDLPFDHPKIYIDALWSQGPEVYYDELLDEILSQNRKYGGSFEYQMLAGILYETYGKNYQDAQEYFRGAFLNGSWEAGRAWGRCLAKSGKPLRGALVAMSAWLARPFLKEPLPNNRNANNGMST